MNIDELRDQLAGLQLEAIDSTYEPSTGEYGITMKFATDITLRFEATSRGDLTMKIRKPAEWIEVTT